MGSVRIFVDDAVEGRLPPVCVLTGAQADSYRALTRRMGGVGAWTALLILIGPIGWVLIALMGIVSGRSEYLTVLLPYEDEAWNRMERDRRVRFIAGLGAFAAGALALTRWTPWLWIAILAGALAMGLVTHARLARMEVSVDLDASRRWATLSGVNEAFAGAVDDLSRRRRELPL